MTGKTFPFQHPWCWRHCIPPHLFIWGDLMISPFRKGVRCWTSWKRHMTTAHSRQLHRIPTAAGGRVSSTHLCVSQPMRMSSPLRATLSSGIHQKGQATQNAVGLKGKGVVKRQKAFHGGMQGRQEEREENMEGW